MTEVFADLGAAADAMKRWSKRLGWQTRLAVWKVAAQAPDIIRRTSATFKPRPHATGAYERGWTYRRSSKGAVVFNKVAHAKYVEGGRRRGARMPPVDAILTWMRVKGLGEDRGHAWAIARAISRRGIRPRPVLARSMPAIRRALASEMAKLVR